MIWLAFPFLFIPQVHHFDFEHSRAARDLVRKYERAVMAEQIEMTQAIERHNRTLRAELQKVLDAETKAGNLDAAIEVRDAISALDRQSSRQRRNDEYGQFVGMWHVQYQNGNTHSFEISRGKGRKFSYREFSRVINGKPSGPVEIRHVLWADGGFLLLNGRSSCNRFHVANGVMYIEHWPTSPKPHGVAPGLAVGRRVR